MSRLKRWTHEHAHTEAAALRTACFMVQAVGTILICLRVFHVV